MFKLEPLLSQMILEGQELYKEEHFVPAVAMVSLTQSLLGSRMLLLSLEKSQRKLFGGLGALGLCHEGPAIPEPVSEPKASH